MYQYPQLAYEVYPYKPLVIQFSETVYVLAERLICDVSFDEDEEVYIIRNDRFDLTVWGQTREEAETAIGFAFDALYTNYAQERDEQLSTAAILLKNNLRAFVKTKK